MVNQKEWWICFSLGCTVVSIKPAQYCRFKIYQSLACSWTWLLNRIGRYWILDSLRWFPSFGKCGDFTLCWQSTFWAQWWVSERKLLFVLVGKERKVLVLCCAPTNKGNIFCEVGCVSLGWETQAGTTALFWTVCWGVTGWGISCEVWMFTEGCGSACLTQKLHFSLCVRQGSSFVYSSGFKRAHLEPLLIKMHL